MESTEELVTQNPVGMGSIEMAFVDTSMWIAFVVY